MIHLVTGGSGSGKSAFAESCILDFGPAQRIYIATMYPFDEESHRKIARHREMRKSKAFDTIECFTGLEQVDIPGGANVLLECMSNLVANEMYQEAGAHEETVAAVMRGVRHVAESAGNLVIVSNEIFSDGVEYDAETRRYQEYLGKINCEIARVADRVSEVVYGIVVEAKEIG
ncbi:MAG: bifunctional adenosylcobinamide kinase/adenosylcobinamide-phosphate guanylyltransferase [Lachnospiraceae bacterium]|nr:bifunctional adenosylcobinamide kinase/adenosylcobinamide-phosphate guanylyltransferase [Lachnospiraceae bacterium]